MSSHDRATISRRQLLACGSVATASGIVAASGTATADDESPIDESTATPRQGLMYPYQYASNARVRVLERLEWRPPALEGEYRTHVVSYDRSPSLRAFLFANGASAETGRTFALERSRRPAPDATNRRLLGVDLVAERR